MDYRRLGSAGLRISRLGLGCGNFGGIGSAAAFFGMGETEAQAFDLMDQAAPLPQRVLAPLALLPVALAPRKTSGGRAFTR